MSTPDANGWIKGPPPVALRDGNIVFVCVQAGDGSGPTIDLADWDEAGLVWAGYVSDYADEHILYHQPGTLPAEFDV